MKRFLLWGFRRWVGFTSVGYQLTPPLQAGGEWVIQNLSDNIKASETRLEKLVESYLDGDVPKSVYIKKKDEIMRATLTLKQEKKDFDHKGNNWVEPLREWILDTKQADFLSSSDNFKEIASFVKKVGTNPRVRDKSARFGVPAPSQFVAERRRILFSSAPSAPRCVAPLPFDVLLCELYPKK